MRKNQSAHLAGSSLPRTGFRDQVKQALKTRPDCLPYSTPEASITDLKIRGKSGVKISTGDLDPAFEPPKSHPGSAHFQDYGHDPRIGNGVDPAAFERGATGGQADGQPDEYDGHAGIAAACQAMEEGFVVQKIRASEPRANTPEWIRTRLTEFIKSRLTAKEILAKHIPLRSLLDYIIMDEHYLECYSDEEVFDRHFDVLRQDKSGQRWTCSVKALGARRERLVKLGDEYFRDDPAFAKEPKIEEVPEAPLWQKVDNGTGGYCYKCAVATCFNIAESSTPIQLYICKGHSRREQALAAQRSVHPLNGWLSSVKSAGCSVSENIVPSIDGDHPPQF
jgi:hypothetical protein